MPMRWIVVGQAADGRIIERWLLRNWFTIDFARADMLQDPAIVKITVIALCVVCGKRRIKGLCTDAACPSRQAEALPEVASV